MISLLKFPEASKKNTIEKLFQNLKPEEIHLIISKCLEYYDMMEEFSQIESNVHYHLFSACDWLSYGEALTDTETKSENKDN